MFVRKEDVRGYRAPAPNTRSAGVYFDPANIPGALVSLAVFRFAPGEVGPEHHHEREVEIYFCQRGSGTVEVDGTAHTLTPGSALYISPGQKHTTFNPGNEEFVFLGIFGPAIDCDFIRNWEPRGAFFPE